MAAGHLYHGRLLASASACLLGRVAKRADTCAAPMPRCVRPSLYLRPDQLQLCCRKLLASRFGFEDCCLCVSSLAPLKSRVGFALGPFKIACTVPLFPYPSHISLIVSLRSSYCLDFSRQVSLSMQLVAAEFSAAIQTRCLFGFAAFLPNLRAFLKLRLNFFFHIRSPRLTGQQLARLRTCDIWLKSGCASLCA